MNATRDFNLDRVSLDGFTVRRVSATLHFGGGEHPDTRDSPYWIYLACEPIPERRYAASSSRRSPSVQAWPRRVRASGREAAALQGR